MKKKINILSARDSFIIEKAKDFKPAEIVILLKQNGFQALTRPRVHQIIKSFK